MDEFKFVHFMRDVSNGYKNVPYHNKLHAADVCQNAYFFVEMCDFAVISDCDDIDMSSLILATACHDYAHP